MYCDLTMYMCVYTYIRMCICIYVQYVYVYICMYIYMYMYICIRTCQHKNGASLAELETYCPAFGPEGRGFANC